MSVISVARAMGLGEVYRRVWRTPVESVRTSILEGGPLQQRRTERGRREMQAAAAALPPLEPRREAPMRELHFLTGRKYWYQTVFCFASLHRFGPVHYVPVLIDDGSIDCEVRAAIRRVIPWARFYMTDQIEADLDRLVPPARYPMIHHWRFRQPLTRKLTDLHGGKTGWKMLLDSDMLFFRRPDWLTNWMTEPTRPAYMVDCHEAYGYSAALRREVGQCAAFPNRANIGIFGFQSNELDLDWLEYALTRLVEAEGPRYNITQGLTSMLLADRDCAVAPEADYRVLPDVEEGREPMAVMHHYVAHSKRSYFQYGWRRVAADLALGAAS